MNDGPATPPVLEDFHALVTHANMAIFLGDARGNTLFANKLACKMFGYGPEEIIQLHRDDFFYKDDKLKGFNSRTVNKAFHSELTGIRKNGEHFPCEIFSVIFTGQNNELRASTSVIDISEKRDAEEQAALYQQTLSLILNNTEESFLLIDEHLHIINYNATAANGLKKNLGVEITIGTSFLDVVHPKRRDWLKTLCADVLQGHTRITEIEQANIDGSITYFKNYFKPAKNEKGNIAGIIVSSTDITAQKAATELLKQTEQRWRFALEGSNHGVWDWNIQTGEVFFSAGWMKIFGFEEDDVIHTIDWWEQRIHPDDKQQVQNDISLHLGAIDILYENEYRFRCKDGSYKWIHSRGMLIEKAEDNTPLRMIGTHTDITEKKTIEENYKLLFNSNPLPMWTCDMETFRFINVNDAAIKHYGYSKEEFLSMTANDIRSPEEKAWLKKVNQEDRTKEQISQQYIKHIKKNGELIFVNITGNIIELQGRKVALILSEDVTQKLKAEEELKRSKEQYQVLFYNNPMPSFIYHIATLQILEVNNAAIQHYGYTKEEFTRLSVSDLWPENEVLQLLEKIQQRRNEENFSFTHIQHKKKNGEVFPVNINSNNIRFNEKECRLVVVNDISAIILAQEELKRSNERFKYAAKASSEALWEWEVATNKVYNSPTYSKIFGYDHEETKLKEWENFIYPGEKEEIVSSFNQALNDPRAKRWTKEYRYRKADDSYAYVADKAYIIRDENGKALRVIGAMQDISAQKYQQQLTELERKLYEINIQKENTIPDIILKLIKGIEELHPHLKGSALLINQKTQQQQFISGSLTPEHAAYISHAMATAIPNPYIKALHLKQPLIIEDLPSNPDWTMFGEIAKKTDSKTGWFIPFINCNFMTGTLAFFYNQPYKPTPLEWNTISKLRNLLHIVMENHCSLEDLKASNERFDLAMKATHDLIWDWDFETGKIYRDPIGLKEVYGLYGSNDNLSIEEWRTRLHPEDYERVINITNSIFEAKDLYGVDLEYRFLKDDGTYAYIYDRGTIMRNSEGRPYRMIGAAQNITKRKQLEQELLENELDRQKEISQASIDVQEQERAEIGKELHDNVNQILTTTKLYLDLALNNAELKDELIDKSNKNVLYVINEIRQLSRSLMNPSIGDLGLTDAVFDLAESINVTQKLKVTFTAEKGIEKQLTENQKLMLYRIIQEALNNAVKHAHAKQVLITLHHHKNSVGLVIEDDGKGFNTRLVKKGAGLTNIQNRVYLTNGTFTIESEPDKGCKLKIDLPINKTEINPK